MSIMNEALAEGTELGKELVSVATARPLAVVKIVAVTILAVVMLGLAGATWFLFGQLKETTASNAKLNEANVSLKHDIELVKLGQSAMLLGQVMSDQQKEALDKKVRETRNVLKQKEQAIDKSTASPEDKARLKSEARMSSVWDNYCYLQPNNSICKTQGVPIESPRP
ncbi:MAG TPA: hypothetical protein VF905_12015 [Nitrospirota bacterium]